MQALKTTHRDYAYGMLLAFTYMLVVIVWRSIDQRPPHWDMARHLYTTEVYGQLLHGHHWLDLVWHYMYYPPVLHIWTAVWQAGFGHNVLSAVASNILWVGLLTGSMIAIGRSIKTPKSGLIASLFFLTLPLIGSIARDFQVDLPLTAMVSLSLAVLLRTNRFTSFWWSVILGVCIGLGLLTKWTYPAFVALPVLITFSVGLASKKDRRVVVQNIVTCAAIAIMIPQPWYVRNIDAIRGDFAANGSLAGLREGDPEVWSLAGWFWYPLAILREYLWLPWLVPIIASAARAVRSKLKNLTLSSVVLASSGLGGLLLFTLLRNKDARYIMPIFVGLSLWAGVEISQWLRNRAYKIYAYVVLTCLVLSYSATSFLPLNADVSFGGITLWRSTGYITGAPHREAWCQDDAFREAAKLGDSASYSGPDSIWFNDWGNRYYAARYGLNIAPPSQSVLITRSDNRAQNAHWQCQAGDGTWVSIQH